MKELLLTIAKGLVENPDAVAVEQDEPSEDGTIVFHLHVAPDDMGRVIGKQGRHRQGDAHRHARRRHPPGCQSVGGNRLISGKAAHDIHGRLLVFLGRRGAFIVYLGILCFAGQVFPASSPSVTSSLTQSR